MKKTGSKKRAHKRKGVATNKQPWAVDKFLSGHSYFGDPSKVIFLTGYPAFPARRMMYKLLREGPKIKIYLLLQDKFKDALSKELAHFPLEQVYQLHPLFGDIVAMDLGLSGSEYTTLCQEVTHFYHMAAISHVGSSRDSTYKVNVKGTKNIIELAVSMEKLERFCHFSSAYVSGKREGVVMEADLERKFGFRNHNEETRFLAEVEIRQAMSEFPITVFRPSIIVGDSQTGEIDRFAGPYYMMVAIVNSSMDIPVPIPHRGYAPLNLVPVDYVLDAAHHIADDPRSIGKTFHLVDPNPLSARSVYELVAKIAGHPSPTSLPGGALTEKLLKIPGLEKVFRSYRQALEQVNHVVIYNAINTQQLLEGTRITCPPFTSYADKLVAYIQEYYAEIRRRKREEEIYDPLDPQG